MSRAGVAARSHASGDAAVAALAEETGRAMGLGIFGSPSFVVDGEVYWVDDRLDDAISWAREGRVRWEDQRGARGRRSPALILRNSPTIPSTHAVSAT